MYIYAYSVKGYDGLLKIGETSQKDPLDRIRQQFPRIPNGKQSLYKVELIKEVSGISDKDIHRHLRCKGFEHFGGEWFKCTVEDIENAIQEKLDIKAKFKDEPIVNNEPIPLLTWEQLACLSVLQIFYKEKYYINKLYKFPVEEYAKNCYPVNVNDISLGLIYFYYSVFITKSYKTKVFPKNIYEFFDKNCEDDVFGHKFIDTLIKNFFKPIINNKYVYSLFYRGYKFLEYYNFLDLCFYDYKAHEILIQASRQECIKNIENIKIDLSLYNLSL